MRVGAASTKSRRFRTAGWVGRGERDGKVYVRNRCCTPLEHPPARNPVDLGWFAARTHLLSFSGEGVGYSRLGLWNLGREAMVKVYGVAMAMPQGYSRVPHPLTGQQ